MKKNKTFTSGLFIAIIAIVTLSLCPSCGNKKGNNLSIPGIDFASAEVGSPEWLMELTPVPLSRLTQHNEHRGGIDPSKPIPEVSPEAISKTTMTAEELKAVQEYTGKRAVLSRD